MKRKKRYEEMTTKELAEATRQFNEPGTIDRTRPLTAEQRRREYRARHPGGRPRIGKGAQRVNITLERDLLARADAIAAQRDMGRSEMIASALEQFIRKAS